MSLERSEDAYIILVEDDPNSYLVIEELLKHAGFRNVYHRGSGAKLIPLVEALPRVDLVLLDIGLPGENGYALLKRLRDHPKTQETYVAAITASMTNENRLSAKDAGFNSYISKPIQPNRICDQVRAMLNGKSFWW